MTAVRDPIVIMKLARLRTACLFLLTTSYALSKTLISTKRNYKLTYMLYGTE